MATMPARPTLLITARRRITVDRALSDISRGELAVRRVSRAALAEALGCSYQMACRKVRGTKPWTLGEVDALAKLLDIDPVALAMRAYDRAAS